jgi:PIN domain nuclease of toxin-antitoxin system
MRLLLDSHILLAVTRREVSKCGVAIDLLLKSPANDKVVSVASLWEIAIKYRLGKLEIVLPLERFPSYFESLGFQVLDIDRRHAAEELYQAPDTRDPFDQMLLAQCQVEAMRLVTVDRALAKHPLAWRER